MLASDICSFLYSHQMFQFTLCRPTQSCYNSVNCISKWCEVSKNISCKQLLKCTEMRLIVICHCLLSWRTLRLWFSRLRVGMYDLTHTRVRKCVYSVERIHAKDLHIDSSWKFQMLQFKKIFSFSAVYTHTMRIFFRVCTPAIKIALWFTQPLK